MSSCEFEFLGFISYVQAFSKKYAPIYGVTDAAIKKIVLYQTWNDDVRNCKKK